MTNRDLLKEAIADAKAIKETAIANAKAALEESFTPHLKSMLAAKINEMDNYYEEDDTMEENLDEVNTDLEEMKEKEEIEEVEAEIEEINLDELLAELSETSEIEEEITESKEEEEVKEVKEEEGEEESEEEEIDLENMSEEDLKNFIESVIEDMISDGEIEAGEGMEAEAGEEEMEAEEEINIDEVLAELKDKEMDEAKKEEVDELKKELDEAMNAIKTLRSELNEINLLNAKLLYTNKIFKTKNLTESEKVKVLAAFDKTTSKNEAKLVYETLIENLSKSKSSIKENLGRASKPAGVAQIKKPIVESNDMVARFQKLAGII
jgi:hypothetical protein